jgi:hypothetical protein
MSTLTLESRCYCFTVTVTNQPTSHTRHVTSITTHREHATEAALPAEHASSDADAAAHHIREPREQLVACVPRQDAHARTHTRVSAGRMGAVGGGQPSQRNASVAHHWEPREQLVACVPRQDAHARTHTRVSMGRMPIIGIPASSWLPAPGEMMMMTDVTVRDSCRGV